MGVSVVRPSGASGILGFVRRCVATPTDALLTAVVGVIVALASVPLARWALIDARWTGTAEDCRAATGACWAFVGHKVSFILFGLYPPAERWRAAAALALL